MRLRPRPTSKASPHQVREVPEVAQALAIQAAAAGVSTAEALRQIVAHYNARPWPFQPARRGATKSTQLGYYAILPEDQRALAAFQRHARKHGVSWTEGLRQCVRRYLDQQP